MCARSSGLCSQSTLPVATVELCTLKHLHFPITANRWNNSSFLRRCSHALTSHMGQQIAEPGATWGIAPRCASAETERPQHCVQSCLQVKTPTDTNLCRLDLQNFMLLWDTDPFNIVLYRNSYKEQLKDKTKCGDSEMVICWCLVEGWVPPDL